MLFAIGSLLALIGAAAANHGAGNEVKLGSAIKLSAVLDASPCAVKVTVPASVVKSGCKLRVRYDKPATELRIFELQPWLAKGGDGNTFADADKKVWADNQFEIDCAAGDYWIGAKVTKCTACIGGPSFWVSAHVVQEDNAIIDIAGTEWYGSTVVVPKDKVVAFRYSTESDAQTAHFLLDKSFTSSADNLKYYAGGGSDSIATILAGNETASTAAGVGASTRVQITHTAKGSYQFVVKGAALTGSSEVTVRFKINSAPDSGDKKVEIVEGKCPSLVCSAEELKGCSQCIKNGCNWCGGLQNSCVPASCNVLTDLIHDDDDCPDIQKECEAIKDCKTCVVKKGCLFCDSGAKLGISTGSCTAGADSLGQQCDKVGTTIGLTKTYKTVAECPASAATITVSIAAFVVAVASLF